MIFIPIVLVAFVIAHFVIPSHNVALMTRTSEIRKRLRDLRGA